MKKFILSCALITPAIFAGAQGFIGPSPKGNYSTDGGLITFKNWMQRTSIGACWGGYNSLSGTGYVGFNIAFDGPTLAQPWNYLGNNGINGGGAIMGTEEGSMLFIAKPSTGANSGNMSNDDIRSNIRMKIAQDGKVSIGNSFATVGITTPNDYKLYVETGILTEKVRVAVKTSLDWSDFVFDAEYKMMALPQLRAYITQHRHLPDVPSAEEVVSQGIDLQKMDAKLLQKVEELTLYVLQQQQEIDDLKKQVKKNN